MTSVSAGHIILSNRAPLKKKKKERKKEEKNKRRRMREDEAKWIHYKNISIMASLVSE